jgi:heterodisulfide reductase subunit C
MNISAIFFIPITFFAFLVAGRHFYRIYQNIHLGKPEKISGDEGQRWRNLILIAFGQKKMFKKPIPAFLHLFIYVAFLFTQVELIEIMMDGIFGYHRFFAQYLGVFYNIAIGLIEILSALAFIATISFLVRRNILKLKRFWKAEMTTWPRLDANLILIGELILVSAILSMNSADVMLQQLRPGEYHNTGFLPVSSVLGPLLFKNFATDWLVWIERIGWWTHVLIVYAFLVYLPFSKHLHIVLAFFNSWFMRIKPRGEMSNMPEVMNEVRSMLGLPVEASHATSDSVVEFGAKDIMGLSWKNLLDAFSCTECGRCTAVCPANITGKKLSPRKVMMDIRDRTEEISRKIHEGSSVFIAADKKLDGVSLSIQNFDDGLSLFDKITPEEINACTACNACVEACPVLIDPLDPILQMRRYQILMESKGPPDWVPMFNSLESSGAVWQIPEPRSKWTDSINSQS